MFEFSTLTIAVLVGVAFVGMIAVIISESSQHIDKKQGSR